MSKETFDHILMTLREKKSRKQNTWMRMVVPPEETLAVTVR